MIVTAKTLMAYAIASSALLFLAALILTHLHPCN